MNKADESSKIIDGRLFSQEYLEKVLIPRCGIFTEIYKKLPKLSTILVGTNPASESYIKLKEKFFEKLCVESEVFRLPQDISQKELIDFIETQNNDESIDGILVQMPLPPHIDTDTIIESITPSKDVEGLSPENVYAWAKALPNLVPATALGALALLKYYQIPLEGKHAVVVGRSMIVGKPMSHLLLKENATVTICHSRTKNLTELCKSADIVITAVGDRNKFTLTSDMIKEGAVVIDVAISRFQDKLAGDADYEDIIQKASFATPVPGGVGPMTVAMLLKNTITAASLSSQIGR